MKIYEEPVCHAQYSCRLIYRTVFCCCRLCRQQRRSHPLANPGTTANTLRWLFTTSGACTAVYQMGGGASTAILHGNASHSRGTCPAATARLNVSFDREGNCIRENGSPAVAKVLAVQRRGDDCDALPKGQRLEQQRSSLPRSGSAIEKYGGEGIDARTAFDSYIDEPTSSSKQTFVAATTAGGEEENARSSSLEDDDSGAMTSAEAARWLNSRPVSPVPCSMTDVGCPTVATVDNISDSACGGGDNRPISGRWPFMPSRSRRCRPNHLLGGKFPKISRKGSGEEASRSNDTTAGVTRDDDKPCSTVSILIPVKSTTGAAALSGSPNAHCCSKSEVQSTSRKPRRDSFSASLQAAINTSSTAVPKQLFQTHHEGGEDSHSSAATAAAVKRPQLQLPGDQQRCSVFANRPTTALTALRGPDGQLSCRIFQEGSRSEDVNKRTRATAVAKESQHPKPPPCLEIDHTSPCSSWMNDEEWLQVNLQLHERRRAQNFP